MANSGDKQAPLYPNDTSQSRQSCVTVAKLLRLLQTLFAFGGDSTMLTMIHFSRFEMLFFLQVDEPVSSLKWARRVYVQMILHAMRSTRGGGDHKTLGSNRDTIRPRTAKSVFAGLRILEKHQVLLQQLNDMLKRLVSCQTTHSMVSMQKCKAIKIVFQTSARRLARLIHRLRACFCSYISQICK